jgi:hypothetical protein
MRADLGGRSMPAIMRVRAGLVLFEALRLIVLTAALGQIAPAATPAQNGEKDTAPKAQPVCTAPTNPLPGTQRDAGRSIRAVETKTWRSIADLAHASSEEATRQILPCDAKPPQAS